MELSLFEVDVNFMFSLPSISCLPDAKLTFVSSVLPLFSSFNTFVWSNFQLVWSHPPRCLVWWRCATVVSWKTPTASMPPSSDWAQQNQKWWIHNSVCCWRSSINPSMPLGSLGSELPKNWGDVSVFCWGLGIRCLFGNGVHVVEESVLSWYFCLEWGTGKSEPATKPRVWHQYNDGLLTGKWCPPNRTSSSVP